MNSESSKMSSSSKESENKQDDDVKNPVLYPHANTSEYHITAPFVHPSVSFFFKKHKVYLDL